MSIGKGKTSQTTRDYKSPVGNLRGADLPIAMNAAVDELKYRFPGLGVTLFVYDYDGKGGMAYASTGDREGVIKMLLNWIKNQLSGRDDPV